MRPTYTMTMVGRHNDDNSTLNTINTIIVVKGRVRTGLFTVIKLPLPLLGYGLLMS